VQVNDKITYDSTALYFTHSHVVIFIISKPLAARPRDALTGKSHLTRDVFITI
jgi:hypothetical protein